MNLIKFWNKKIKAMDIADVALIKLSVFTATLLITKYWKPLLELDWYWYVLIFTLAIVRPFYKFYLK